MMTQTQIHAEAAYRTERAATARTPRGRRQPRTRDASSATLARRNVHAELPRSTHAAGDHRPAPAEAGADATTRTRALEPA